MKRTENDTRNRNHLNGNNEIDKMLEKKRRKRRGARLSSFLAVVVALTTVGTMVLPARTLTATAPDPVPDTAAAANPTEGDTRSAAPSSSTETADRADADTAAAMPEQRFEDRLDTLGIAVDADAGAFPADTTMQLAPVQDIDALFDTARDTVESQFDTRIQYLESSPKFGVNLRYTIVYQT